MENGLHIPCSENQNTRFVFNTFFSENHAVYDNVENCGGARENTNDDIIWRMRCVTFVACLTFQSVSSVITFVLPHFILEYIKCGTGGSYMRCVGWCF
jgi:hypothetical protein